LDQDFLKEYFQFYRNLPRTPLDDALAYHGKLCLAHKAMFSIRFCMLWLFMVKLRNVETPMSHGIGNVQIDERNIETRTVMI
jgi:hypothetical protein